MKIKIIEGEAEKVINVKFLSFFKAWFVSLVLYILIIMFIGLVLMKFLP